MTSKLASIFRAGLFSKKVAIVTGGGSGIGRAITTELATLGCSVVIASRNAEKLNTACEEINDKLPDKKVFSFPCNIRDEKQVQSLMTETVKQHGALDYLVNNGGGQFISPFANMNRKGWDAVVDTNLNGTFHCLREAYHAWMGDHGGSIVNIVVNNFNGMPFMSHTAAARAGVMNLTKTLALEWAANNIRINSVAPGVVYSDTAAANYANAEDVFVKVVENIPAGRTGTVEEVSAAVCFLLSPAAAFINGDVIKVDGAQSLYKHSLFEIPEHDNQPEPFHWQDVPIAPPKSKL